MTDQFKSQLTRASEVIAEMDGRRVGATIKKPFTTVTPHRAWIAERIVDLSKAVAIHGVDATDEHLAEMHQLLGEYINSCSVK